jgi:hypothetical protein
MTYNQYLNRVIDDLFKEAAKKWTWTEWAEEAGVCYTTVFRLGTRKTKRPQLRTVFLLAKSLGINLPNVINNKLRKVA